MINTQLQQEDFVKCLPSSGKKFFKCIDKLNKKSHYYDHSAKASHCIANKCPAIYNNLVTNAKQNSKKILNLIHSSTTKQINNVVNTKCKTESDAYNNNFIKTNECSKKYDTYDGQRKCDDTARVLKNYSKCSQRYSSKSIPKKTIKKTNT